MQNKIIEVLKKHVGRENAIPAKEIAALVGRKESESSQQNTRNDIKALIEDCILPIASCKYGYFVISNVLELNEYTDALYSRIMGITVRRDSVIKAYCRRG